MFSKGLLVALAAARLTNCRSFEVIHHIELDIRQATTTPTTSATDANVCELPASLRDNSIYEGQPTGSQDLLNWLRALPCEAAACCIPASLSQDWADYVSDSNSWWSDRSSVIEARTEAIFSWYSSAAELPACFGVVQPLSTTILANSADPLGHTCPTATSDTLAGASATASLEATIASSDTISASTSRPSASGSSPLSSPGSDSSSSSVSVAAVSSSSSAGDPANLSFVVGNSFSCYALISSFGIFALAIGL